MPAKLKEVYVVVSYHESHSTDDGIIAVHSVHKTIPGATEGKQAIINPCTHCGLPSEIVEKDTEVLVRPLES